MHVIIEQTFDHDRFEQLKIHGNNLLLRLKLYSGAKIHQCNTLYSKLNSVIIILDGGVEWYREIEDGVCKGIRHYYTIKRLEELITTVEKFFI